MSNRFLEAHGNGKRHHTPTPASLRKIKRISLEAFLGLKELFKNFRRETVKPQKFSNSLRRRAPKNNNLKTGIHLTSGFVVNKNESAVATRNNTPAYEPTRISNAYNSSFWQWRRVTEWYRYISDPMENNKNGHIIT